MTRPKAWVLALPELLQSGGTRTVGDLADRLSVDERTLRRYVAHLLELNVPVISVRGRYGGYRLGSGYRLPPLMLTVRAGDHLRGLRSPAVIMVRHGNAGTEATCYVPATGLS